MAPFRMLLPSIVNYLSRCALRKLSPWATGASLVRGDTCPPCGPSCQLGRGGPPLADLAARGGGLHHGQLLQPFLGVTTAASGSGCSDHH